MVEELSIQELAKLYLLSPVNKQRQSSEDLLEHVWDRESLNFYWDSLLSEHLFGESEKELELKFVESKIENALSNGMSVLPFFSSKYPAQLRSIVEMPYLLWSKGSLISENAAVSIVGSRNASSRGLSFVSTVVSLLKEKDITIVSGLADGIDTQAHKAALNNEMRTVAVLGNGLNVSYPKHNAELQQEISKRGLVISQFEADFSPTKFSFPMRNCIMSGYSRVSLIVEANEHSGTRIQGRVAVAHGRTTIITRQVFNNTLWGKKLSEQPRVHIANDEDEAAELCIKHSKFITLTDIVADFPELSSLIS